MCQLLAFGQQELASLLEKVPRAYIGLLLAAGLALAPIIRRFISLGLNRVWLNSGDTIYRHAVPVYRVVLFGTCGSFIVGGVHPRVKRQEQTGPGLLARHEQKVADRFLSRTVSLYIGSQTCTQLRT